MMVKLSSRHTTHDVGVLQVLATRHAECEKADGRDGRETRQERFQAIALGGATRARTEEGRVGGQKTASCTCERQKQGGGVYLGGGRTACCSQPCIGESNQRRKDQTALMNRAGTNVEAKFKYLRAH